MIIKNGKSEAHEDPAMIFGLSSALEFFMIWAVPGRFARSQIF